MITPYSKKCVKCGSIFKYALKDIKRDKKGAYVYCKECYGKNNHP